MIYLDTSVVLAALFDEQRRPAADLWRRPLVSSRLLAYELPTRCRARGVGTDVVEGVLARVDGQRVTVATYDARMATAAAALGLALFSG